MNTHELTLFLSSIESTPAKTEKLALLKSRADDPLLKYVIWATYEPTRNYFIKKIPAQKRCGTETLDTASDAWWLLSDLEKRVVTGKAAQTRLRQLFDRLEPESAALLTKVLKRDLRIGVAEKGFHQAFPGLLSKFDVMLASTYQPFEGPRLVSPKIDGMRILAKVDRNTNQVSYFSRNGKPVETMDHLSASLLRFEHPDNVFWLDGEGTAPGGFAQSISSLRKNSGDASSLYNIFDVLPEGLETDTTTMVRYETLLTSFVEAPNLILVPAVPVLTHAETIELYGQFRDQGYEGAIVKDPTAGYQLKRSKAWTKIKPTETLDLPVVGAFEGTGKYEGKLGGLIVLHGLVEVSVGSGFSDQNREVLWAIWQTDPDQLRRQVLEVSYHEETPDGSLRHPRAKRFRGDKA